MPAAESSIIEDFDNAPKVAKVSEDLKNLSTSDSSDLDGLIEDSRNQTAALMISPGI